MKINIILRAINNRMPWGKRFTCTIKSLMLFLKNRNVKFYKHQFVLNLKSYFYIAHYTPMYYQQTDSCPTVLYHITEKSNLQNIMSLGILNNQASVVFLSVANEYILTLLNVKKEPIIIQINASQMHRQGYPFFTNKKAISYSNNRIQAKANTLYLTYNVPTKFIDSVVTLSDIECK